nr:hypothetical protein [Bacteroidota bacterium]
MRYRQSVLFFSWVLLLAGIISCSGPDQRKLTADISDIDIPETKMMRYEKALFAIDPDSLKNGLKGIAYDFPIFLNADLDDTLNLIQMHGFVTSELNIKLYDSVESQYPDLSEYEKQITNAFKYFKYHFPDKDLPKIFSYVSGLIFEYPVQFINGDMIIALDMYLGSDFPEYRKLRLPLYKINRMNHKYILRDGIYELYYYHFLEKQGKNVLEQMISKGKHLYFLDAIVPDVPDHIKIGYPEEKSNWCIANESNIWAFIIENELLYASDSETIRKFFTDGPFTHSFSVESPARIGEWMGWQIIRAYMNNNPDITLTEMLEEEDAQKILEESGYKPRR